MTGTTGAPSTGTTSEGSVSFSLKELTRLEDERVAFERDEARRRREELERNAADQAKRAQEAVDARARAEDERRKELERHAREEDARLEGQKRAFVERERLAAEQRARDGEVARLHTHELELTRLRTQGGGARIAWSVAVASLVCLVAGAIAYAAVLRPDADRQLAQARADVVRSGELVKEAERQVSDLGKRVDGLAGQLQASEEHARDLERQLDDAKKKVGDRRAGVAPPPTPRPPPIPTRPTGLIDGPCKYPGDPLCAGK